MAHNKITAFRRTVWAHYKKHGRRDLPWRNLRPLPAGRQAYKILVSEVMLQQTQVERVKPFYTNFLTQFSTVQELAAAPLGEVLKSWQGLGYNRRAKMLHQAAKMVVGKWGGTFPQQVTVLESLPGVGPYTARAVAAFAYNQDVVFVETNIRTAILHNKGMIYHTGAQKVSDAEIAKVLERALPKGRAREWYAALMDYGAHLKQLGVKLNTKSKHYTKQSRFSGSLREARGVILRELAKGSQSKTRLTGLLGDDRVSQLETALAALITEHLIQKRGKVFTLPQ